MTAIAETADIRRQASSEERNRAALRWWLYIVALAIFALVLVGGATRLTDSGLSITQWKPIHGVVPPLSVAEWEEEFALYRQIPEYEQINKGMSLGEFKVIYWWEWTHRFLARLVGVLFAVPLALFWIAGRIPAGLKPRLVGLFLLGGLQGAVGWWMVASGLTERTDVSQYRLAIHLTLASVIFAAIVWVARGLAPHSAPPALPRIRRFAGWMVLAVLIQIYLGGLVAGLDAGFTYNTSPLMDGALVPGGLFVQQPWWINLFENPKTVQFVHRIWAYAVLALALWHVIATIAADRGSPHCRRSIVLFLLLVAQAGLGIATLLTQVHLHVALTHQAMALVILAFAVAHWRGTVGPYTARTAITVRS